LACQPLDALRALFRLAQAASAPVNIRFGVLVGINLLLYLPIRLGGMVALYNISRSNQAPFHTPAVQAVTSALVIVHAARWMEYGALLELENPELTTPFIFAWVSTSYDEPGFAGDFPNRAVYHHYPGLPFQR
jgi:hypothetical protein